MRDIDKKRERESVSSKVWHSLKEELGAYEEDVTTNYSASPLFSLLYFIVLFNIEGKVCVSTYVCI